MKKFIMNIVAAMVLAVIGGLLFIVGWKVDVDDVGFIRFLSTYILGGICFDLCSYFLEKSSA